MMATRTISLSDDAYLRLSRLKRRGESFSDVVHRLTGRADLERFVGAISQEFADELVAAVKESRAEFEVSSRAREKAARR